MKRFLAFMIDALLVQIIFAIVRIFFYNSSLFLIQAFFEGGGWLLFLIYNFVYDYFYEGISIGKKLLGIKTVFLNKNKKFAYCLCHGFLRIIFVGFFPLALLFYFFIDIGKMPYDLWLDTITVNIESEDNL